MSTLFAVNSHPSQTSPWKAERRGDDGKRVRRYFKTEREAKAWAEAKNIEIKRFGASAVLPDDTRIHATVASGMLASMGVTLTEAAEYYIKQKSVAARSVKVGQLLVEIEWKTLKNVRKEEVSREHYNGIKKVGKRLILAFGDRLVSEIQRHEIVQWLESLDDLSLASRDFYRRYAIVIFAYALDHGYTAENPALKIKVMAKKGSIEILTPDEVEALLRSCDPSMIPFYALGVFAGLRPMSELMRTTWEKIDWEESTIDVENIKTAGHNNSARNRHVHMSTNLIAWLEKTWSTDDRKFIAVSGRVVPGDWRNHVYGTKKNRKIKFQSDRDKAIAWLDERGLPHKSLDKWPPDAMRHTFASWHYAIGADAGKTSAAMGHMKASTVFSNYNKKLKPKEAQRYLEIMP